MNDSTLTRLKIIVERAVRPVRASTSCKRKMREELLAHVSGIFEEESARLPDEQNVLARTQERFGSPIELADQLRGSIPASDAIARFAEWAWFRPGESMLRCGMRYALLQTLILIFFLPTWYVWTLFSAWVSPTTDWPVDDERLLGSPVLLFDFFFFTFSAALLVWGLVALGRAMTGRFCSHQEWANLTIDQDGSAPA